MERITYYKPIEVQTAVIVSSSGAGPGSGSPIGLLLALTKA